ncbi:YciI family protein [Microbacterium sp. NPDC091313]
MTKYLLTFPARAMQVPDAEMPEVSAQSHALIAEAKAAGVYVFGGGIAADVPPVRIAADGTRRRETYPQTRELDGGVLVLEVATRDDALEWARRFAVACRCDQEVREFGYDPAS